MIQTVATLMVGAMMMGGAVVIGGVFFMSKKSRETPAEFVKGFFEGFVRGFTAPSTEPVAAAVPQQLDVRLVETPAVPVRPGKASAIVLLALAVLYLLSPLDFIPDVFVGPGQLDDLGFVALAIRNAFKAFS